MLETVAMVLFILWALALVSGAALGLAVHFLFLGGVAALLLHHRSVSRLKSDFKVDPSRVLARVIESRPKVAQRPAPPAKSDPKRPARPTAAA